ncbi:hypothetical protein F5877DRAFT_82497 [Lentinula edodes]|nr:hypothetical protein F5877DRAFT_82497 [Lentinula edodes]
MPRCPIPPLGIPRSTLYCNLFLIVLSHYTYPFIVDSPYCLLLCHPHQQGRRNPGERVKVRNAEEEATATRVKEERKKKTAAPWASAERKKAAQQAQDQATRAQEQNAEVIEQQRLLAEATTARSQRGTLPSEMLVFPRRPVVEIRREKGKWREKVQAQIIDGDPDNGNDGDNNDNDL